MNCPTCNTALHNGQRFCPQCGASVGHITTPPPAGAAPPPPTAAPPRNAPVFPHPPAAPTATTTTPIPAAPGFSPPSHATVPPTFNIVEQTLPVPTADPWQDSTWAVGGDQTTHMHTTVQDTVPYAPADAPVAFGYDPNQTAHGQIPVVGRGSTALMLVAALAGVAAIVGSFLAILTITTDAPIGAAAGDYKLNDLMVGTNLQVAVIVAGAMMIVGAVLARTGRRLGAGTAAGAAVGLVPFVVMAWVSTLAITDSTELAATSIAAGGGGGTFFQSKPGIGTWVLIGAAALGVIGVIIAFAQAGADGRTPLHRGICAIGAVAAIVAAAGQLVPQNGASFADNFDTDLNRSAAVFSRIAILALVAIVGVVGFLLGSRWGVGLAVGGISLYTWQWLSSMAELGDAPAPPAFGSPGALDGKPHIVTTIGVIAVLLLALLAVLTARSEPDRPT